MDPLEKRCLWTFLLLAFTGLVGGKMYKIGLLAPMQMEYEFSGLTSVSAVSMAIDRIHGDPDLNANGQIELTVELGDTRGSTYHARGQAVDLLFNHSVDVFIGPPSSAACRAVAEIAAFFDVPIISWVATDPALNDRSIYSTLSRTLGPFSKMGMFLLEIFRQYNWKRVVIVRSNYLLYWDAGVAIRDVFKKNNITVAYESDYDRYPTAGYIKQTLTKTKEEGRIVILASPLEDRRRFMLHALDMGMCGGDYVFYTIDMLPDEVNLNPEAAWKGFDGRDDEAKRAFESVFHVSLAALTGRQVDRFREEVAMRMREPPWNITLGNKLKGNKYAAFLYDAVSLYAMALSDTILKGENDSLGRNVVANMKNKMFSGYSGNVILDENGDRETDYWLMDMDPETGIFEKMAEVVNLDAGKRLFRRNIRQPMWPGGKVGQQFAPPDTPEGGFRNNRGALAPWVIIVAIVASCCVVSAAVTLGVVLFRQTKFEKNLLLQTWRVYYADIEMINRGTKSKDLKAQGSGTIASGSLSLNTSDSSESDNVSGPSSGAGTSSFTMGLGTCTTSVRSFTGSQNKQIFTDIGYHKGVVVALKRIKKEHIQLSRTLLIEFSDMRDVAHDNLNIFIGACIDPPNICLLWQYCHKGSIQDLVMNDEVKLDNNFKLSFLTDIGKGMDYLHKSHLRSHGNLKSSNCLVDARWIVKITDYGIPSIFSGQSSENVTDADLHRKKLWTAPELLRENFPPARGSPAGDVYSFGIVCYEITMRTEPYTFDNMTPRDVVNRVRNGESIPFRPQLPDTCELGKPILDLIGRCWNENPENRPTFVRVLTLLRKMAGGEINIMDKILEMMEMYSNNLEQIVDERTGQLAEEKKKTDRLLYRMLPSTVVEQLKSGKVVKPEHYDQSSIYFSDIVGFTTIAADSNPMQIVDFLNDLYTCFDDIISQHDVYKVETIGDAYMVMSGVPIRNGSRHVQEIANVSLDLLSAVTHFKIRHRPHEQLQLRIGIHTGPVVAGVVGLMMPRYCLFGETVNTATKMESSGKPLRIHMSKRTYQSLKEFHGYEMTLRGEMNIQGKGLQKTYWLHGKQGFDKPLPIFNKEEKGQNEETKPGSAKESRVTPP